MLRVLVSTANQFLTNLNQSLWRGRLPSANGKVQEAVRPPVYRRLERVLLTDEVNRTILEEFSAHRETERGEEETGWILLGVREENEATVLATLPAGAARDAGVAHVLFNSTAQAVAMRIVQQWDRRLTLLGVLHTHPGSLRHPSSGDYRGDSQWVGRLRGKEGIFGIGTADVNANGAPRNGPLIAHQPSRHQQIMGELCLSWYALGEGDHNYHPLEVDLTLGPDLARKLRPLWPVIEEHADEIERLCLQQRHVRFEISGAGPELGMKLKLSEPEEFLCLLFQDKGVEYYVIRGDDLIKVDPKEPRVDRGVYLILAELAGCIG